MLEYEDDFDPLTTAYKRPRVVDMAAEILGMHDRIQRLERDVAYYKPYQKMYMDELNKSIAHSQHMMGTVLCAMLDETSTLSLGIKAKAAALADKG